MVALDTQLEDVRIFLALPFQARLSATCQILDLRSPKHLAETPGLAWLAEDTTAATHLWTRLPIEVSSELHPSLASALGGAVVSRRTPSSENEPGHWQLDTDVREALNRRGGDVTARAIEGDVANTIAAPTGHGIVLRFSKAAERRLGSSAPTNRIVAVRIADVRFYLSQTRFGQLVFELSCSSADLSAALVVEILHALAPGHAAFGSSGQWKGLGRLDGDRRVLMNGDRVEPVARLSLHELAEALVCAHECSPCFMVHDRAFTYTLASTREALNQLDARELAARLARRFTADYTPDAMLGRIAFARSFETVTHACSIEGGAALVTAADTVDFLKSFTRNNGEKIYLPLALLANKEFHDLVALSQGSVMNIEHAERDNEAVLDTKLARLLDMQERVLNFRLAHRFSVASFSSNHNLVHEAWRQATGARELLSDVSGDIRETETLLARVRDELRARADREHARSLDQRTALIEAFLTFLAALEGARVLLEISEELFEWPSPTIHIAARLAAAFGTSLPPPPPLSPLEIAVQASPLVIGFVAALGVWLFARHGARIKGGE